MLIELVALPVISICVFLVLSCMYLHNWKILYAGSGDAKGCSWWDVVIEVCGKTENELILKLNFNIRLLNELGIYDIERRWWLVKRKLRFKDH